jgi:hypothetical protein
MNMNLKPFVIVGALLVAFFVAPGHAQAPKPDPKTLAATGILERLAERSGVYGVPPTSAASMSPRMTTSGSTSGHAR